MLPSQPSRQLVKINIVSCIQNRMQTIETVHASQARSMNKYLNTKHKLLNCNANTHFNRTCLDLKLVPKYAKRKIKSHSKTISNHLTGKMQEIRIENEIQFWYKEKQMLNKHPFNLHLVVSMAELVKLILLDTMTDGEIIRIWKEVIIAYPHLPEASDKNTQSGEMMSWARCELSTSPTQA
jgi:hypothetical protein